MLGEFIGEGDSSPGMVVTACRRASLLPDFYNEQKATIAWLRRMRGATCVVGWSTLRGVRSKAFREARICG